MGIRVDWRETLDEVGWVNEPIAGIDLIRVVLGTSESDCEKSEGGNGVRAII